MTAASAVSRAACALCSAGLARSCARMSGEALMSTHSPPARALTAIEDWVRARARSVPARRPAQLRQLQFHWGKPPPAADPSTRILTTHRNQAGEAGRTPGRPGSAPGDVHRDFHAETHVDRPRSFPTHADAPHCCAAPRYRISRGAAKAPGFLM